MLTDFPSTSSTGDLESGLWISNTKLRPLFEERMRSGQQHLGSLIRQLDSIYCTAMVFIRRNSNAKIFSLVYLVFLHLWVIYILMSHAPVSEDTTGAVISLENINKTGGIWYNLLMCITMFIGSIIFVLRSFQHLHPPQPKTPMYRNAPFVKQTSMVMTYDIYGWSFLYI